MTYEWEKQLINLLDEIEAVLPEGIFLVSLGVQNIEQGEGALVQMHFPDDPDVSDADVFQDIMSDAARQYGRVAAYVFATGVSA